MNTAQPLISVIIPVFNGEKYIDAAIESVLMQDYCNKEIIIIDDGSTDNTASIVKKYPVRYCYQENKGAGAARNTGVRNAFGTHFAFLDHDDLWMPSKLTVQMQLWQTSCDDPLIFGMVEQFICSQLSPEEKNKIVLKEPILPGYAAGTIFLSKKRFYEAGFFSEEKNVGEFIAWYACAGFISAPKILASEIILKRRLHTTNMSRQNDRYSRQHFLKIIKEKLNNKNTKNMTNK